MRVLVADQDAEHRAQLVQQVQSWGHTVQEALTGRDIVEQCRKKCPDLIFIDGTLAGESGADIVRQIRQTGGHALWVPVVLLGNNLSEEETKKGISMGVDDILPKPLLSDKLQLKVNSAQRMVDLKEEVFKVAHELVLENRTLQTVITQDMLTGLNNSNSLDQKIDQEWSKFKKSGEPLSLILLNLDFFHLFNDAYGAKQGDEAIKKVADALKQAVPPAGFLARTTGETFAVVLPNTKKEQAIAVAEQLHKAIDALNIPHKSSGCGNHLTASFGVATASDPKSDTKSADLKDAADFGLFQAKHYGRNRVYSQTEVEPAQ